MQADNENKTLIDRDLENLPVSSIKDSHIKGRLQASPSIELSPRKGNTKTYRYTGRGEIIADITVKVGGLNAELFQGNPPKNREIYQVQGSSLRLKKSSQDQATFTLKVKNLNDTTTTLFDLNGSPWNEVK